MRWKWILGILAAVLVGMLVVAYIIAASYDYNRLKPLITDMTKEYTGRVLTLGLPAANGPDQVFAGQGSSSAAAQRRCYA